MDPLRIAIRVALTYFFMLALVRVSGKRTVRQGGPFDFTLALILGDMMDDAIWAEVAFSHFVVATGVLVSVHSAMDFIRFRAGASR